jgi:methylglyoxal synthase
MNTRKRNALVAHGNKKADLLDWVRFNRAILIEHELFATGATGGVRRRTRYLSPT